jgi:hypothetical protein
MKNLNSSLPVKKIEKITQEENLKNMSNVEKINRLANKKLEEKMQVQKVQSNTNAFLTVVGYKRNMNLSCFIAK